jgi:hypothetical protein
MNLQTSTNLLGYFIVFIALIIILVWDIIFATDSFIGGFIIILGIVVAVFGTFVLLG